ncbi:MAG: MFS transporter [Candidatus Helarchaeota archaeon]|nr:MFS transporter [Candidatus Helarchaeota archaeon]
MIPKNRPINKTIGGVRIERSELIRLSIGSIGMALSYNVLTMNLQDYLQKTAFSGNPNLAWLHAFTVITIAFGIGAFTFLFAGWLSDKTYTRWGRRPYLLFAIPGAIALILLGLNYISLPFASIFILLSCLATTYMVTYRLMYTSYFALYQDLTKPEDRVKTTVTFNIFGLVGIGIAIVIPLFDPATDSNYFAITLICSLVYIATVLFVFFFGPKEKLDRIQKVENPSVLSSIGQTFKDKNFKNYALASFFASFTFSMMMFILKPFLDWKLNPSTVDRTPRPVTIPIDFMVLLACMLPLALLLFYFSNYAAKRWGKLRLFKWILIFSFLTFPFGIFLTNQGSPISLIIQLFIVTSFVIFVIVIILSLQNAILMDITPKGKEATYTGVFFFMVVAPFPLASQLAGVLLAVFNYDVAGFWLGNNTGSDFAYALMMIFMAIALFISWLFLRRVKYEEVIE